MSNTKQFPVISLESPLVKIGEFTDSKGDRIEVTPAVLEDIFNSINQEAPLRDIHDQTEIGQIKKVIKKADGLYQKTLITDNERFNARYGNGHFYVSPEITIETNEGRVISASLKGAALTANPGMIREMPQIKQHNFEAPPYDVITLPNTTSTSSWTEPLTELKGAMNALNSSLNTFGEQVKNMTPPTANNPVDTTPQSTQSAFSADDLAKLVNDAIEKRLAASQEAPKSVPEASEVKPVDTAPLTPTDEMYAKMMSDLQSMKDNQEKVYRKQLNTVIKDIKGLGIEHPEKMIPEDVSTEQKISILESFKENFAKNSPMSAPLQEPIAGAPNGASSKKNSITIDDILSGYFDEVYGSDAGNSMLNDPELRHNLGRLSNTDLLRKYNLNVLFDDNGTYIGPV